MPLQQRSIFIAILCAISTAPLSAANRPSPDFDQDALNQSLRVAAREGRMKDLTSLLRRGADVNGTGQFGETALMSAARFNQTQAVQMLLNNGADPSMQDSTGKNAIHMAAIGCTHRTMDLILDSRLTKGMVDRADYAGKTPLIHAAIGGCAKVVDALLKKGKANPHIRSDEGFNALDFAVQEANVEMVGPYSQITQALMDRGVHTDFFVHAPKHQDAPKEPPPALPTPSIRLP